MKRLFLIFTLMLSSLMASAQVSAKISEILSKMNDKMEYKDGTKLKMKMSMSMVVSMGSVNMTIYSKGDKSLAEIEGSVIGKKIHQVDGDDGIEHWQYDSLSDSLIISKSSENKSKSEFDVDLDVSDEYNKASLKEKGKYYEITLSDPINEKETPSKTTMKINKETYMLEEMTVKQSVMKMTITVLEVSHHIPDDSIFTLDKSKYPTAKIEYK